MTKEGDGRACTAGVEASCVDDLDDWAGLAASPCLNPRTGFRLEGERHDAGDISSGSGLRSQESSEDPVKPSVING
jgi:hypothetical protein